jgi:hypothetical protein
VLQLGWCPEICRSVQVGLQTPKVWICWLTRPGLAGPWSRTTRYTYYPFWSLVIITLDIFVIWAIATHGGDLREPV